MDYGKGSGKRDSPSECQRLCQKRDGCKTFVWKPNRVCWLKSEYVKKKNQEGTISGQKYCDENTHAIMPNPDGKSGKNSGKL